MSEQLTRPFSMVDADGLVVMQGMTIDYPVVEGLTPVPGRPPGEGYRWTGEGWLKMEASAAKLETLKMDALATLEEARLRKTRAVIEYQGFQLDADVRSQENIKSKLLEITEHVNLGTEIPTEQLFWRDFNNEMHYFDDMQAYRAWLGGLAIAITQRGTMLYAWSWQLKAQIESATTIEEIQALNLE